MAWIELIGGIAAMVTAILGLLAASENDPTGENSTRSGIVWSVVFSLGALSMLAGIVQLAASFTNWIF